MPDPAARRLLLFTKPARAGRVKTRLIGDLTAAQAADLHRAFVADLVDRLRGGSFGLRLAWALDPGEDLPAALHPGLAAVVQRGDDLGTRLHTALAEAAREAPYVAALGSDHPTLPLDVVHRAFAALEAGAPVVLGPAEDGGYYLIAIAARALGVSEGIPRRLFEGIDWSTGRVFAQTLERCRELGIEPALLPMAADVDTPDDLRRLALRMADGDLGCPRTRDLLATWGRLPRSAGAAAAAAASAGTRG
ncbi:MAG TPA: TIGR04282 family arsenosugar biosynthesis glycosyltransferase [Thermoanaerobaculia bacterium]|nr:TIGR04282 family arsenosugar biosynthesis glycosyltransferase [Thermoanaerobaculia bacterium]